MRLALATLITSFLLYSGQAFADRVVVVELFTSQGCSSCPPADALLGELAEEEDVLALALHVDYWDYIGWKDSFADPRFTERQKRYAHAVGAHSIFTPQMVIDGALHVVGFKPMKVARLIDKMQARPDAARIEARRTQAGISISVSGNLGTVDPCDIVLVRYLPGETVKILRGENAGSTIRYRNIVADMQVIGQWDGSGKVNVKVPASGKGEFAVLLQHKGQGPIMSAARVE